MSLNEEAITDLRLKEEKKSDEKEVDDVTYNCSSMTP